MAEGLERGVDLLNFLRKGECVIEGGTREPSFFWQFVNVTQNIADCLKRVVSLE